MDACKRKNPSNFHAWNDPLENRFDSCSARSVWYTYARFTRTYTSYSSASPNWCVIVDSRCGTMCRNITHHYHGGNKYATPGVEYARGRATYVTGTCDERERAVVPLYQEDRGRGLGRGPGATAFTWTLARHSTKPSSSALSYSRFEETRAPSRLSPVWRCSPVTEHAVPLL